MKLFPPFNEPFPEQHTTDSISSALLIQQWRDSLLRSTLRLLSLLGGALLLLYVLANVMGAGGSDATHGAMLVLLALLLMLLPWLGVGYPVRLALTMGLLGAVAVLYMVQGGVVGIGRIALFGMVIAGSVLLNRLVAMRIWMFSVVVQGAILVGIATGAIQMLPPVAEQTTDPFFLAINWLFQSAVSGILVGMIVVGVARLHQSLAQEQQARLALLQLNSRLEQRVAERTAELEQANARLYTEVAERTHAMQAMRASEMLFRMMFERNQAVKLLINPRTGMIVDANPAACQYYGYSREQLTAMSISQINILPPEQIQQEMNRAYTEQRNYFIFQHRLASGEIRDVEVYSSPLELESTVLLYSIVHDITRRLETERELQRFNARLQQQATRDALTGLYNRRYLDEMLPRELERAGSFCQPVGVVMLDIDHFKHYNDTYGHDAGDLLLRTLGEFLNSQIRSKQDIACRYGGEEFVLILPGAALPDTLRRAEQIRVAVSQFAIGYDGVLLHGITISLGVAIFPQHGLTADALMKAADSALYNAKHNGRNQVTIASNMWP